MTATNWFTVDREGLRKLIEHRGKALVLFELIQNAWDTDAQNVSVQLSKDAGSQWATLVVTDDNPKGFTNIEHAYTLFAESEKKTDPTKRGRFNLGEKLILSMCRSSFVMSTTGTICFDADGTRRRTREKTESGSVFSAVLKMSNADMDEFVTAFGRLIAPPGCTTTLIVTRGAERQELTLAYRTPVAQFMVQLSTLISNADGEFRPTKRQVVVEVHEPKPEETAVIYEMGIPIVGTGDRYHVNIHQKIPLNMDRDNVTPAYLTAVRTAVLNHMASHLSQAESAESWVTDALGSADIEQDALQATITTRFGPKRAIFDPSDREANNNLVAQGYTLVHGPSLPAAVWTNVREHRAMLPAGRIAPTPVPYSSDPSAPIVEFVHEDDWTQGMREVWDITRWVAKVTLVHEDLGVQFAKPSQRHWDACFGTGGLHYNMTMLGKKWFDQWSEHPTAMLDLIIHELAHSKCGNHLDETYHKACTLIGARLAMAMFRQGNKAPHFRKLKAALKKTESERIGTSP